MGGERPMTSQNHKLGEFNMGGLAPAPRGTPQIEVTFEIDTNGVLNVGATDKARGKSESITITNDKGRLSEEDIERMIKEAEQFADEHKKVEEICAPIVSKHYGSSAGASGADDDEEDDE